MNDKLSRDERIFEDIKIIIDGHISCDPNKITRTASLVDDLGCDSLDMIELVMAAEEKFEITIADDEAEKVSTVQDCVDLVVSKLNTKARVP